MSFFTFAKLGLKHFRNAFAEFLYLKTGLDITRPVAFYGYANERCNARCRYCEFWRKEKYKPEMSIKEWQKALLSIKDFVGTFQINFSGGEPFLRPDFIKLLAFCRDNGIQAGVTTNGVLLASRNIAKELAAARPFNINVSIDSSDAKIHDYIRGVAGTFDKAVQGIKNLVEEKKRQKIDFPIIIKPTITALNYRGLPELIEWAKKIGANSINFQPLFDWTPETRDELWLKDDEILGFEEVIKKLIKLKKQGAPILNSEEVLKLMPDNFRKKKAPESMRPCLVGLRNFFIRVDGEVRSCFDFPALGNIKKQTAREIWYSKTAREVRKKTLKCPKLCLMTCASQKTLWDKFRIGWQLLKK